MKNEALTDWLTKTDGLAHQLAALRSRAGFTLRGLAQPLDVSDSTVSRIERGLIKPNADTVDRWAELCNAPQRQRKRLQALIVEAETVNRSWRRADVQSDYAGLAETTVHYQAVEALVIPGPLQIEPYAAARMEQVTSRVSPATTAAEREVELSAFLKRARMIHDPAKRFDFVIAETALGLRYTEADSHRAQLAHLLTISHLDHVDLAVLPNRQQLDLPLISGLSLWDGLAIIETMSNEESHPPHSPTADMYSHWFTELSEAAAHGEEARQLIQKALDDV